MTKDEFIAKRKALKSQYLKQCNGIDYVYAKAHNRVKVGDMLKGYGCTMKVESMMVVRAFDSNFPSMLYTGSAHTQAGKPFAKSKRVDVYQNDIKTLNGKPYEAG